jgi:hypothetical protein
VTHRFGNTPRALIVTAAVVLLALTATWSASVLERQWSTTKADEELIYFPSTRFLSAVSLGYEHALADVLWFRAISYFGRHYQTDRVYPWMAHMCDVVTDLDPRAEYVYRFGGVILPWEANRIDDGIALLEKGARNMPTAWRLHYMLGFSYYLFKDDLGAAGRALRAATLLPDTPEFVSRLAALIYAAHEGPSSALDFLVELERNETNAEMRGAIQQTIRDLSLTRDIDSLDTAVGQFQARWGRPPGDLTELVSTGMLHAIPAEPFGGRYFLDRASGHVVSSSGHKPSRLGSSTAREAFLRSRRSGG